MPAMQLKSKQVPGEAAGGERKGPGTAVQWSPDREPRGGIQVDVGGWEQCLRKAGPMGRRWPSPPRAGGRSASCAAPDLLHSVCARGRPAPLLPAVAQRWEQSGAAPACWLGLQHP